MLTSDPAFREGLSTALSATEPVPIASLTDFEWDQMGFVPEGTPRTEIEELFGDPLIKQDYYASSDHLFIFLADGEVVRAIMVSLNRFDDADAGILYGPSATIAPDPDGSAYLRFSD